MRTITSWVRTLVLIVTLRLRSWTMSQKCQRKTRRTIRKFTLTTMLKSWKRTWRKSGRPVEPLLKENKNKSGKRYRQGKIEKNKDTCTNKNDSSPADSSPEMNKPWTNSKPHNRKNHNKSKSITKSSSPIH